MPHSRWPIWISTQWSLNNPCKIKWCKISRVNRINSRVRWIWCKIKWELILRIIWCNNQTVVNSTNKWVLFNQTNSIWSIIWIRVSKWINRSQMLRKIKSIRNTRRRDAGISNLTATASLEISATLLMVMKSWENQMIRWVLSRCNLLSNLFNGKIVTIQMAKTDLETEVECSKTTTEVVVSEEVEGYVEDEAKTTWVCVEATTSTTEGEWTTTTEGVTITRISSKIKTSRPYHLFKMQTKVSSKPFYVDISSKVSNFDNTFLNSISFYRWILQIRRQVLIRSWRTRAQSCKPRRWNAKVE